MPGSDEHDLNRIGTELQAILARWRRNRTEKIFVVLLWLC